MECIPSSSMEFQRVISAERLSLVKKVAILIEILFRNFVTDSKNKCRINTEKNQPEEKKKPADKQRYIFPCIYILLNE